MIADKGGGNKNYFYGKIYPCKYMNVRGRKIVGKNKLIFKIVSSPQLFYSSPHIPPTKVIQIGPNEIYFK